MQLLLTVITTLLASILVVLVPGASLLAAMRLDRIVHPPLVPAAALALGMVPLAAATAATLALRQPIEVVLGILGAFTLLCWSTLARRQRRSDLEATRRGDRRPGRLQAWARPVADLLSGDWLRGTPMPALAAAGAGALLALYVGHYAWNDSLYHIGQAQKLLALDAPSFTNTLQYPDGSAHPGYLLPLWQESIALVARVAGVDPVTAAWILPGLTFPVSILAVGGLGWAMTRARHATTAFALTMLIAAVALLPDADPIVNGMHPGAVALGVLAPLALAMLFTALWPNPEVDTGAITPRMTTRAATFVCVVAVAGIGALHVGYLWVFGLGVLGYALVWAIGAPWPRPVVMRHLATGGAVLIVAAACLAVLLPGLTSQEGLGRDAQAELQFNESAEYAGENGANLDALLRGSDTRFHLRADYLVLGGGLALVGLLLVPLALFAPRWPAGWYLVGSSLLVLVIALTSAIFPTFVKLVTLDQARRVERVLPLAAGLAIGALAVGAGAVLLWRRGGVHRISAALLAAGAASMLAYTVDTVPPLAGYGGERIVEPRVIVAVMVLLAAGTALHVAVRVVRALRARGRGTTEQGGERRAPLGLAWQWPTDILGPGAAGVASLVLLVGAAPVYGEIGAAHEPERVKSLPDDMRTAEMRLFSPTVAATLRDLPSGSKVMADPRSRDGYMAMAIAPVYVVSSVPRHTALTPRNRVQERFRTAVSFFEGVPADVRPPAVDADEPPPLTTQERLQLLIDEEVDAVVINPRGHANRFVSRMLAQAEGVKRPAVTRTDNQRIFLIDRAALRRELESAGERSGPR